MSLLSSKQTGILASFSKSGNEGGVPQAMAPVRATFALSAPAKVGFLANLFGGSHRQKLLDEFEQKKLEAAVKEALLIELNRIALIAGHQRLVDHLYVVERQSELSPRVATHFAQLQSDIQKAISQQLLADAEDIEKQRQDREHALSAGRINARAHTAQLKILDATENQMMDNLHGLWSRLTENAARDLLRTLNLIDADHQP